MEMFLLCSSITVFIGLPANFLVLIYFTFGRVPINKSMKTLHIWIVVTDMIIAVILLPFTMDGISQFEVYTPSHHVLCEILEFSGDMWIRISYFLICMISVVRLRLIRRIKSPGTRVKVPINRILIAACLFFAVQSLFPIVLRHIQGDAPTCIDQKLWEITFPDPVNRRIWRLLTILLQVVSAILIIVVVNSISIYHLLLDEGRKLSSVERLTIQWVNTTFRRQNSVFDEPSLVKVKTFAACVKAASITLLLAFVFFCLHISGVIHTCCKILSIETQINGEIANSISYLTPAVQCIVYGLNFKGFWVFWYNALLRLALRVKGVLGYSTVLESRVSEGQSEELLNDNTHHSRVSSQVLNTRHNTHQTPHHTPRLDRDVDNVV